MRVCVSPQNYGHRSQASGGGKMGTVVIHCPLLSLTYTLLTHAHSLTFSQFLTYTLTATLILTHTLIFSNLHIHAHSHTTHTTLQYSRFPHILSHICIHLSYTFTLLHIQSHNHSHSTYFHTHNLSYAVTHTIPYTQSVSFIVSQNFHLHTFS